MTPFWTVASYLATFGLAYLMGYFTAALMAATKRRMADLVRDEWADAARTAIGEEGDRGQERA